MKAEKYDPTADVVASVTATIQIATPKNSLRGRKERDRIAREVIIACKGMMNDKRMKGK